MFFIKRKEKMPIFSRSIILGTHKSYSQDRQLNVKTLHIRKVKSWDSRFWFPCYNVILLINYSSPYNCAVTSSRKTVSKSPRALSRHFWAWFTESSLQLIKPPSQRMAFCISPSGLRNHISCLHYKDLWLTSSRKKSSSAVTNESVASVISVTKHGPLILLF